MAICRQLSGIPAPDRQYGNPIATERRFTVAAEPERRQWRYSPHTGAGYRRIHHPYPDEPVRLSRPITPRLDALRKSDTNLIVFNDVYTIELLQQALTFADQQQPDRYLTQPSLMNMMKQAGYKTFWITNQQTTTKRNTMLTVFSQQTDRQFYLNNQRTQSSRQYDDAVLTPFDEVLRDPADKKFIVVHLLGTHMKYLYRYPESYERFNDRKGIPATLSDPQAETYNSYDNAVLYNDFVVDSLIETFARHEPNGFLLYFSDHGEDVYETPPHNVLGRNEGAPTRAMYTVPFIL